MSFSLAMVLSVAGILLGISFIAYLVLLFNNYIVLRNNINKSQANIDVLLKQRFDELPKLVDSVKGYMKYESGVLSQITRQRTSIMNADMDTKAEANKQITRVVKSIFVSVEKYPQLKTNTNILQIQERISTIETEISQRREFYNESANNFNNWIESFPNNLLARVLQANKIALFETKNKTNIKVNL